MSGSKAANGSDLKQKIHLQAGLRVDSLLEIMPWATGRLCAAEHRLLLHPGITRVLPLPEPIHPGSPLRRRQISDSLVVKASL